MGRPLAGSELRGPFISDPQIFFKVYPLRSRAAKLRTTSLLLPGYLGTSVTSPTSSVAYSAYQPPTGQAPALTRRGPTPATSPLSQLSLGWSEQKKPLLSENLKRRRSDKAEELPETD
ncbi:LOW QUALITY PROTEIN: zinc finger E-box-binding homeobox 2b [Xyrichtys novacula]|uniref:LOW QUALITY PROTEIN: zinc finger E-box-binding homeobox 2b n=1 Tax=Xyrichtys novacula TaxID=13765 RepID=A0AAV1HP16_XYRNO|nr:LOW QUALITY PROTEIN: zinc finger E-box-binding homeobox 2b [Xyrichtys novacula]